MINVFGSNHTEIGDLKENLILKTAGKVKIQVGKKFIDLLDSNGNINVQVLKIIRSINSLDLIKSDGFYYYEGNLLVSIGGKQITLTTESGTTYVSFVEKQDVTEELQHIALKNIGFLYDTLNDVKSISGSIIYVESEKSLYIVLNGTLEKYFAEIPNPYPKQFIIAKENQDSEGALVIQGNGISNSLHFDGLDIFLDDRFPNYVSNSSHVFKIGNLEIIKITNGGVVANSIKSEGASFDFGYRLYINRGESTLEVDNLIVRNGVPSSVGDLLPVEYYKEENIILSILEIDEELEEPEETNEEETNEEEINDELKVFLFTITDIISDSEIEIFYEGIKYYAELKYINTFLVGDTLQIFSSKSNFSDINNVICCLIRRNNQLNDDLVIGKLGSQYNEKSFGIISKQNIFYSAKYDYENSENPYPFYSNKLYNLLESTTDDVNIKYIIPPLGLVNKEKVFTWNDSSILVNNNNRSIATGEYSMSAGEGGNVNGNSSFSYGVYNNINGSYSYILGSLNLIEDNNVFITGNANIATSHYSGILGGAINVANNIGSTVIGYGIYNNGTYSFSGGIGAEASIGKGDVMKTFIENQTSYETLSGSLNLDDNSYYIYISGIYAGFGLSTNNYLIDYLTNLKLSFPHMSSKERRLKKYKINSVTFQWSGNLELNEEMHEGLLFKITSSEFPEITTRTVVCFDELFNYTNGDYSFSYGRNLKVLNNGCVVFGNSNTTTNAGECALGYYNISRDGESPSDLTLFTIGNGTNEYNRKNAFEIRANGDIYITKDNILYKLLDLILTN